MKVAEWRTTQTLQLKISANLEATRQRITIKYFLPADKLHRLALKRRFQLSNCRLLTSAVLGFIAEIDIKNYTKHEAVMDLLAITLLLAGGPNYQILPWVVHPPIQGSAQTQICSSFSNHQVQSPYQRAQEINGHEPRQTRIRSIHQLKILTTIRHFHLLTKLPSTSLLLLLCATPPPMRNPYLNYDLQHEGNTGEKAIRTIKCKVLTNVLKRSMVTSQGRHELWRTTNWK
jgi:hypothetical protein